VYARLCAAAVALASLLCPTAVVAQADAGNLWFVRAGVTPSFILPTNPFSLISPQGSDVVAWAPGVTVEVGRRTDGTKDWHDTYNLPSYGFGVSTAAFENHGELVRPIEAYGFFSWPFARIGERLGLTSDFGLGLSWNWTTVNSARASAPLEVLGSNLNARIDWGFYLRYITTPRTALYAGIDFTHRSNGGLVQPNQGINVLGPKVSVQYNFGPDGASLLDQPPAPPFHPSWDLVVGASGGVKNVLESTAPLVRQDFGALDVTAAVRRHFYTFGRIVSGADLMYDGSTGAALDADGRLWRADSSQRWALGIYGGYEHIIGRFSALLDIGCVVARGWETPETPRFYERYGWSYQLSERLSTGLSVRAVHGKKADALEVGVGYRIPTSWGVSRSR
jgi:hypothetical protein